MFNKLTGLNKDTKDNRITGAGIYFKNYDIKTETPITAAAAGKLLGATFGGGSFEAKANYSEFKVDGIPGKVKGFDDVESWDISLMANLIELTPENVALALGPSTITTETINTKEYKKIEGKSYIEETDYQENITFIGMLQGYKDPVIIQIYDAISMDGMKMIMKDGEDSITVIKWEPRWDIEENQVSTEPPFSIFMPTMKNTSKSKSQQNTEKIVSQIGGQ